MRKQDKKIVDMTDDLVTVGPCIPTITRQWSAQQFSLQDLTLNSHEPNIAKLCNFHRFSFRPHIPGSMMRGSTRGVDFDVDFEKSCISGPCIARPSRERLYSNFTRRKRLPAEKRGPTQKRLKVSVRKLSCGLSRGGSRFHHIMPRKNLISSNFW